MNFKTLACDSFELCPVWKWGDDEDSYEPVWKYDPLPDDQGALLVRARLTAASGEEFSGYLIRGGSVYAVGIFLGSEEFVLNVRLPEECEHDVDQIRRLLGAPALRMFPLRYRSDVRLARCESVVGEFSP
jgi:hypothetical protein